jgi:hypothetical protein
MAIGLNDLRKHLLSQSKVDPLHVVPPPEKPAALQSLDDRREATEPQIYSVRKLLQNVSPDLEPVEQPAAVANAFEHVSEAPDGATSEDASSPKGLSDAVLSYVEKTGARDYQVFQAVAKVFEQTRGARDQLNELTMMYEPIEALGQAVAAAFGPLETFRQQLAHLARSFDSVKAFQLQVTQLAETCDAIKPLREQIGQLTGAFQIHLAILIKALEPAEELRVRIVQLAEAFEPATTLHEKFSQLFDSFDVPGAGLTDHLGNGDSAVDPSLRPAGSAVTFYVDKSA